MKNYFNLFLFLLIIANTYNAGAQNDLESYKKQQETELKQYKKNYAKDIATIDRLYKNYLSEEKERYAAYKNLGYIPRGIAEKVAQVEKLHPKETTVIPYSKSISNLTLTERKWEETKAQTTNADFEIPDEIIPLDNENELQVVDVVKDLEIVAPKQNDAQTEELKMEIEANRPVFCPLPEKSYRVSSEFSKARKHPVLRIVRKHEGIDLAAPRGTKVYAAADGVVTISKYSRSAGKYIVLNHQNGYTTSYMHLSKRFAKNGQKVKRGQLIGEVGNTGISTGNHLHYEVRKKGDAYDPKPFIAKHFKFNK